MSIYVLQHTYTFVFLDVLTRWPYLACKGLSFFLVHVYLFIAIVLLPDIQRVTKVFCGYMFYSIESDYFGSLARFYSKNFVPQISCFSCFYALQHFFTLGVLVFRQLQFTCFTTLYRVFFYVTIVNENNKIYLLINNKKLQL